MYKIASTKSDNFYIYLHNYHNIKRALTLS